MEDQKHVLALEALYIKFTGRQKTSEDKPKPKQRQWWPAAPVGKTSSTAPANVPPSPPQLLWPHHKLTGASSATLNQLHSTHSADSSEESNTATSPATLPLKPLYAAIFLAGPSKQRIIQHYPPRHSTVYCHHVTLQYFGYEGNVSADVEACVALPLSSPVALGVTGAAVDAQTQALAVTLPSWVPYSNSAPPHVTVSVVDGVQAKEAGALVATAAAHGDIEPIHGLRVLHGVVGVCLTDRSVVYTREELFEALQGSLNEAKEVESSEECADDDGDEMSSSSFDRSIGISSNGDIDLAAMMRACFNIEPAVKKHIDTSSNAAAAVTNAADGLALAPSVGHQQQQQQEVEQHKSQQRFHNNTNAAVFIPHPSPYGFGRGASSSSSRPRSRTKRHRRGSKPKHAPSSIRETKSEARIVYEEDRVRRATAVSAGACPSNTSAVSPLNALSLEIAESERTTLTAHHQAYQETQVAFNAAQASGDAKSARTHAHKLKQHAVAAAAARRRASAAAFHAHNAEILNSFRVDLHGLHVKEAINVLKRYIDGLIAIKHPGGCLLQIVTGFGKHSIPQGRAKVLPAVIEYLADNHSGLLFDVEENNPGVIRVLLEPLGGWWL